MSDRALPRLKPSPVPQVQPIMEFQAEGRTAEIYDEIKAALGLPWVGVLCLAYARYPTFFEALWRGLQPISETAAFWDAARDLRATAEHGSAVLGPDDLGPDLAALGYTPRELDDIRATIEVFSHGNFPYLMIATIARLLIEGGSFGGAGPADRRSPPTVAARPLVLIEAHHADPALAALYDDIKQTLDLPFVNTDYRALARWPSYFERAWAGLRPHPGGDAHERTCVSIHEAALEAVIALPNPGGLTADDLQVAARADASLDEVRDVCRLFQHLLPGLVVNVAFFDGQLGATGRA